MFDLWFGDHLCAFSRDKRFCQTQSYLRIGQRYLRMTQNPLLGRNKPDDLRSGNHHRIGVSILFHGNQEGPADVWPGGTE